MNINERKNGKTFFNCSIINLFSYLMLPHLDIIRVLISMIINKLRVNIVLVLS